MHDAYNIDRMSFAQRSITNLVTSALLSLCPSVYLCESLYPCRYVRVAYTRVHSVQLLISLLFYTQQQRRIHRRRPPQPCRAVYRPYTALGLAFWIVYTLYFAHQPRFPPSPRPSRPPDLPFLDQLNYRLAAAANAAEPSKINTGTRQSNWRTASHFEPLDPRGARVVFFTPRSQKAEVYITTGRVGDYEPLKSVGITRFPSLFAGDISTTFQCHLIYCFFLWGHTTDIKRN